MITRSDDISMILVVSRERDNLVYNCLTTSDRQYGYQIQQCESNSEALEISQQPHIDCILLDWGFSGLIEKKFLEQLIKNFIPMVILVNEGHENTGTDYL
jgi:DNA-binding response OmpR family regulator